uniref:Uncharacterized protein n=1 Tax=Timema douglasi TaxID=61478 RepID=A0A7R8Z2Z1_TIMDO|nr:unnamed protein product [Timema douglasi]
MLTYLKDKMTHPFLHKGLMLRILPRSELRELLRELSPELKSRELNIRNGSTWKFVSVRPVKNSRNAFVPASECEGPAASPASISSSSSLSLTLLPLSLSSINISQSEVRVVSSSPQASECEGPAASSAYIITTAVKFINDSTELSRARDQGEVTG